MNLSGLVSMSSLRAQNTAQAAITIVGTQPIIEFLGSGNTLSAAQVNAILIVLDANGLSNGTVDLSGQTPAAPPTGAGLHSATNLYGKFWLVTVDGYSVVLPVILADGGGGFWSFVVDINGNRGTISIVGAATSSVILDDGGGGFWKIIVDTSGNVGAQSDAGPATDIPILSDGSGGYWIPIADTSGNVGTQLI
jgi:hypothetical protein